MKLFRLCLLVLLTLSSSGSLVSRSSAQSSAASWTVMVYMAADNDLETFGLADVNEMEFAATSNAVRVVAQVDRSADYNTTDGNWTEARRYLIQRDTNLSQIGSTQLESLGEVNTGDPQTLVDFVTWAAETYPADHYALVIWDHGGAWLGGATDAGADYDDISLPELTSALDQIQTTTGIEKLDLLGFDACLMGAIEVYEAVAPYAHYAVASAELIPGNGWDYYSALDALVADPSMDGQAFGRVIVDTFNTFYQDFTTNYPLYSLALVDLSQTQRMMDAFAALGTALEAHPEAVASVGMARSETLMFGAFDDPSYTDLWAAADLLQFMQQLATTASEPDLQAAAQEALDAGRAMTVYYRGSEPLAESGGVSIYFPRTFSYYQQNNRADEYAQYAPAELVHWQTFLNAFYTLAAALTGNNDFANAILGLTSDNDQVVVDLQLGGTGLVQATFVILFDVGLGQQIIVDYDRLGSGETTTSYTWDAQVPYLSDGHAEVPVLVLRGRNPNTGVVNGIVYPQNGDPISAQLLIDLTTNETVSVWGVRQSSGGQVRSEVAIESGDLFQPTWLTLDDENHFVPLPAPIQLVFEGSTLAYSVNDTFYGKRANSNSLFLTWHQAPRGAYEFQSLVDGIGGGTGGDTMDVGVTDGEEGGTDITEIDLTNPDIDADGILNEADNCYVVPNPDQSDVDGDAVGDVCDLFDDRDPDQDGITDDNCPTVWNADQADSDGDGIGDVCDTTAPSEIPDRDGDGIADDSDNCPDAANPDQADGDGDHLGNACDDLTDSDADGIGNDVDNCTLRYNPEQIDSDNDGLGDACDEETTSDRDGDGIADDIDNCPNIANPDQADSDNNGIGDVCAASTINDMDGDWIPDDIDNCPVAPNTGQEDADGDGLGDWCDNCPQVFNPDQTNSGGSGSGDVCEASSFDLAVSISESGTITAPGGFDISVTVTNNSSTAASGIRISTSAVVSGTSSGVDVASPYGPGSWANGVWDLPSLGPGASGTLTLMAFNYGGMAEDTIVLTASLISSTPGDTVSGNNQSTVSVIISAGY